MPLSEREDANAANEQVSADKAQAPQASEGKRIWRLIEETACVDGFKRCRMETMIELAAGVTPVFALWRNTLFPRPRVSKMRLLRAFVSRPLVAKERAADASL